MESARGKVKPARKRGQTGALTSDPETLLSGARGRDRQQSPCMGVAAEISAQDRSAMNPGLVLRAGFHTSL